VVNRRIFTLNTDLSAIDVPHSIESVESLHFSAVFEESASHSVISISVNSLWLVQI
jgi:hypothetical protein